MNESKPNDLVVRQPVAAELARVAYLFRNVRLRPDAHLWVAVRSRPIERFVAAAAWWPEGNMARFQLATQPGIVQPEICRALVDQISAQARGAGLESIQYGELLADDNAWVAILRGLGFELLRSERFFEVTVEQSWIRFTETYEKNRSRIPAGWRTESIRQHSPETILELLAPYRLMPPAELRDYWRPDSPFGFQLDLSSILFDGNQPIGAFLTRKAQDLLFIDIRVVNLEHQLLRALGNILLFRHMALQRDSHKNIRFMRFRAGATEHRETANLARRMEGREMPPRHIFSKSLSN